jgi:hypothetical protein
MQHKTHPHGHTRQYAERRRPPQCAQQRANKRVQRQKYACMSSAALQEERLQPHQLTPPHPQPHPCHAVLSMHMRTQDKVAFPLSKLLSWGEQPQGCPPCKMRTSVKSYTLAADDTSGARRPPHSAAAGEPCQPTPQHMCAAVILCIPQPAYQAAGAISVKLPGNAQALCRSTGATVPTCASHNHHSAHHSCTHTH